MLPYEKEKQGWAKQYSRCLQGRFNRWQKLSGIDGDEYRRYLAKDLCVYYDDPLLKSLIESIC